MKKKLLTVALAAVMVIGSAFSAMADLVSTDTTFDGTVVADGSAGWASAGTGKTFPIDENGVTVVFTNDAFIRDTSNWSNFIIETIATDTTDGFTARADAYSWTYEKTQGTKVNTPTATVETTWGDDWTGFAALSDNTDVTVNAKKTDANTVVFTITFATDAAAKETYTVTYPEGVPSGLEFQVGADGGKITLKSATFGSTPTDGEDTTEAPTNAPAGGDNTPATPNTGDATMVGVLLAVAAVSAVVVLKKRAVAE